MASNLRSSLCKTIHVAFMIRKNACKSITASCTVYSRRTIEITHLMEERLKQSVHSMQPHHIS